MDARKVKRQRKRKIYRNRRDPFKMDDYEFYKNYIFDKVTTKFIIQMVEDEVDSVSQRGLPVSISLQVLSTLMFLGRHVSQGDIANHHGFSQSRVSSCIKNITKRLASHLQDFIQFPKDEDELNALKTEFYEVAKFPCVIGAIGCMHLKIKSWQKNVETNEGMVKSYHPFTMQIVCDANCKILDCVTSTDNSEDSSRLWSMCELKAALEATSDFHKGVLLGDGTYPASNIMLTPAKHPLNETDLIYNRSHTVTREKVLSLNRQLKSKVKFLLEKHRLDLESSKDLIASVVVLHNIAKERNLPFLDATPVDLVSEPPPKPSSYINECPAALNFRTTFINQYF